MAIISRLGDADLLRQQLGYFPRFLSAVVPLLTDQKSERVF